jgi:hypothetical protein
MTMNNEQKAHEIETQYDLGQNIWRRPSVCALLTRIDELEQALTAAHRRGWEQRGERDARKCYESEQKIRTAVSNLALTEKEAFSALAFVGAYRDEIRFMPYEPEAGDAP